MGKISIKKLLQLLIKLEIVNFWVFVKGKEYLIKFN